MSAKYISGRPAQAILHRAIAEILEASTGVAERNSSTDREFKCSLLLATVSPKVAQIRDARGRLFFPQSLPRHYVA